MAKLALDIRNMERQDTSEEITFGHLAKGLRSLYHSFLVGLYRFIRFVIKNGIVLLILLIVGIVISYFLDSRKSVDRQTQLIVQVNFAGVPLTYDAIDQLNGKIKNEDEIFLKKFNLYGKDGSALKDLAVEPVTDFRDVLHQYEDNLGDNTWMADFLGQVLKMQDEFLKSEVFIPQYKRHKIKVKATAGADESTIQGILAYLNTNQKMQEAKSVYRHSLASKIHEYQLNIAQLDSLLQRMGERDRRGTTANPQISIHAQGMAMENLDRLLIQKNKMMNDLERYRADELNYENPVVLLNMPFWETEQRSLWIRFLQLPFLLILGYMLLALAIAGINKGKALAVHKEKQV